MTGCTALSIPGLPGLNSVAGLASAQDAFGVKVYTGARRDLRSAGPC
jgi:hypothetical protein